MGLEVAEGFPKSLLHFLSLGEVGAETWREFWRDESFGEVGAETWREFSCESWREFWRDESFGEVGAEMEDLSSSGGVFDLSPSDRDCKEEAEAALMMAEAARLAALAETVAP